MILIIGNSIDKLTTVVDEIQKISDKRVVLFKADKCLENESVGSSLINGRVKLFIDTDVQTIDLEDVKSIWYWKPVLPKVLRTIEPEANRIFIYRQFLAIWSSIASILSDKKWLNDYWKMIEAERKPYQIKIASEIGFTIPDTLITSNPDRAKDFWNHCQNRMVIKALMLNPTEDTMIYTNEVTEELMSKIERLKTSPVILQKLVQKKYELRITVVGDNIFPARVESKNKIDWRKSITNFISCDLPDSIKQKCFQLVKKLGLQYGCIDMIVTPDSDYTFLEINPNGQWQFVEEQTNMPISKAIARLLI